MLDRGGRDDRAADRRRAAGRAAMSGLEIRWPDHAGERVRAATGRLLQAGPALRARPLTERIAAVARVLGDWTAPDSPWRRELAESFAATSGFSHGTVAEGLESALRAWSPRELVAAAERELAGVDGLGEPHAGRRLALAPFDCTAVLAGGTIPMPTLLSSLLPLILGSPVLLRESAKDPVTGGLLARSLAARDPGLARAFLPVAFDWEDTEALDALLSAPCVVATGADETMRAIAARLGTGQRFVAYGHRVSLAVFAHEQRFDPQAVADALALDVARWDQTGCLSPIAAYLVGFDAAARAELAHACLAALTALSATMPRGALSVAARAQQAAERGEARMRAASDRALLLEGRDATVVLESDASPRPAPLHRFLRLHPVEDLAGLDAALAGLAAPLSNVALAGFAPGSLPRVEALLAARGASRIAPPGTLQTPPVDWPRDGMPILTPLARFCTADAATGR